MTAAELEEDLERERQEHGKTKESLKSCIQMLSYSYGLIDNISSGLISNLSTMVQLKQQILEAMTQAKQQST